MGQVQYNLMEVSGGSEKLNKNGFVSFVKPDVEFTGLKLNTTSVSYTHLDLIYAHFYTSSTIKTIIIFHLYFTIEH